MKTSRRSPLALLSIALLLAVSAGLGVVQNSDLGLHDDVGDQLARVGIEGEEIPVPFTGA
ncbi:hypothetical protein [Enhygromyxa salina]|uniref:Uncharacterized protein n=1 Tax=Enhygromyxa salina TaxID=215803 RepID=A0A2S9YRR4_9BACT|nr:hypothetical protein [Enhygromyxa salina]PRQ07787.1 hypothetical protein ENSA7_24590 [Enhygromyxa salina]